MAPSIALPASRPLEMSVAETGRGIERWPTADDAQNE
jgi:hypothetical protein